jgi:hypothetical protein
VMDAGGRFDDSMKLGIFLRGLPDEYQVCVTHLEFEQHMTYAVACQRVVDFALRYDLGNFGNGGRAEEGIIYAHTPKTQLRQTLSARTKVLQLWRTRSRAGQVPIKR